jgi:protein-tyrosine phosphatase
MAEGLLKNAFPEKTVRSAGINAMIGYPADPFAVELMRRQGIDISAHRAQSLTGWAVSDADLILTMDLEQKLFIEQKYVISKGKVFRFHAFGNADIPDPYRQDFEVFRRTYDLIERGVSSLVERIGHFN